MNCANIFFTSWASKLEPQSQGVGLRRCLKWRVCLSIGCITCVFWFMVLIGIFVGNIVSAFVGWTLDCFIGILVVNLVETLVGWTLHGYLVWGDCRDTLWYGAGNRDTLRTITVVVSIGYGTGWSTLRDGSDSGTVEGAIIEVFLWEWLIIWAAMEILVDMVAVCGGGVSENFCWQHYLLHIHITVMGVWEGEIIIGQVFIQLTVRGNLQWWLWGIENVFNIL